MYGVAVTKSDVGLAIVQESRADGVAHANLLELKVLHDGGLTHGSNGPRTPGRQTLSRDLL